MAKEAECLELAESYVSVRDKKEAEEERKKFLSWFYKKHGNSTSNRYVMEYRRGKESILSESTEDCYEHFPEEEGSFPEALIEEEGEDETEEEEEEEEEDDDDEEEEEEQEDDKGDTAMNEVEYARLNELDILNCDGWLKLSTDNYPWKESPSVYPTTLKFEEIKLTAEEKDGLLTVPIVSTGLSNLSLVPGTVFYALTKLELPKKNLLDISILSNYQFLQYIDISFNRLSDLSPLSQVIYLMVLDASNNQLTSISGFKPPWFLTYLNISWNLLAEIPDLTEFWSLRHVDLSHNRIKTISGLINLKFLSYLNLSYNEIKVLENLSKLPVQELDVSYNVISSWEMGEGRGLRTMHKLKELNLSFNRLTSLLVIKKAFRLLKLNVSFNQISCMHELGYLSTLTRTNCLFLEGNDVSALEESRRLIIYLMPSLAVLNGSPVLPAERVCAVNMYSSDVIVGTMRRMLIHSATFGALSPPLHGVNAMSRMYNPAIVVVIGLPGSYKTVVVSNVAKKYPKFIKLGRVHTTRVIKASEQFQPKDLYKYIELDEFNKMKENGRFAAIEHRLGFKFGVSFDDILFDGRVCLLQMEFGGGLELQWTGYDPTLILALPGDISTHISRVLTIYECDANIIKSEEESFRTLSENEHTLYAQPSFSTDTLSSTKISKDEMINKFNNELMSMNNYFSDPKLRYQDELKFNMRFQPEKYEQDILKSLSEQSNKSTEGSTVCPPEKNPSGSSDSSLLPGNEEETHDFHWKYKTSAQLYVASVMELRDQYIEAHINNPGLFTLAVATDDLEVASHKVASVCHEVFNNIGKKMNDSQNRMMDMLKQDECYNDVVGVRLANMMHELRAKQSTAQEQQYESELIRTSKDN